MIKRLNLGINLALNTSFAVKVAEAKNHFFSFAVTHTRGNQSFQSVICPIIMDICNNMEYIFIGGDIQIGYRFCLKQFHGSVKAVIHMSVCN